MSVPYYYQKNNKFNCFENKKYNSYDKWRVIISSLSILIFLIKIYLDKKNKVNQNVKND
jgi:hypothetical protein